jgi:hypothetical protein
MTVIETFERADRDSATKTLSHVISRRDNLKAEIDGLDTSIEAHYAPIGRIHCREITNRAGDHET